MMGETKKLPFLCTWIVRNGQQVGQVKRDILAYPATLANSRVRRLSTDVVKLTSNSDLILPERDDPGVVTPTHYSDTKQSPAFNPPTQYNATRPEKSSPIVQHY